MPSRLKTIGLAGAALLCLTHAAAAQAPAPAAAAARPPRPNMPPSNPADVLKAPRKPSTLKGAFDLVSIGDLLYSHPMADNPNPEFQKVLKIVKSGDVTIGNQEGVFIDLANFKGEPYSAGGLWGEGSLARDMKAMGVDMVSVANNHSLDFGHAGLLDTIRNLDDAGMVHAGGGASLTQARKAGILTTPKGRIALVSTASSFKPGAGANDPIGNVTTPRPGISILKTRKVNLVTAEQMAMIKTLATEGASLLEPAPPADAQQITYKDQIYRVSATPGLHYDMDLYDETALLKAVREAKEAADLVVFTIHAHESATGFDDDTPPPPDFLIKLFHETVDAGADVVMGGGPHSLRGVEIYNGQPIFYGLGVFFIKGEIKPTGGGQGVWPDPTTGKAPPPRPPERSVRAGGNPASWYDGVIAQTDFKDGKAKTIRLYPLDVGNTYEPDRRGNPHLADPANAKRILADLQKSSAQFGTRIAIQGSVGVIKIP